MIIITQEIPIKKNEYYEVEIHGIGHEGEGVGRINNFTIFVPYTIPGDSVKVKVIKVKKSFAYGKLIEIIKPSDNRVTPICSIFEKCGGCQLQHVNYIEQLRIKKQKVIDALERIGKINDVLVHDTIGMKHTCRYRNKAQFPVGVDELSNRINIGFYAQRSHRIIDMKTCHIQHNINDVFIPHIKKWMERYNITAYNEKTGKGLIRHVFTRIGFSTGEVMVVIVANGKKIPNKQELIDILKSIDATDFTLESIIQNINTKRTNVILGSENKVLWGRDYITDSIGKIEYKISPMSFYQVNPVQTEVLYNIALEYAGLEGNETVFDLYCGIGTISLFLAQKAKRVVGVEIILQAIEDAKKNAIMNNIDNVEFHIGAAEEVIPQLYKQGNHADVVVVDPPRKGCEEKLLNTIAQMQVDKIVYVSCNPSTLARDLRILEDKGYKAMEVQPVDMFPHTVHVETCSLIIKKD